MKEMQIVQIEGGAITLPYFHKFFYCLLLLLLFYPPPLQWVVVGFLQKVFVNGQNTIL